MTKADEIIELFKRDPFHPDPQVHQQILRTSLEDILERVENRTVRKLREEIEVLEEELHDLRDNGAAA